MMFLVNPVLLGVASTSFALFNTRPRAFSICQEDLEHTRHMRASRLHLAPGMARASLHRAIVGRPGLAALLGPQQ